MCSNSRESACFKQSSRVRKGVISPPPAARLHAAVNFATAASHSSTSMKLWLALGRHPLSRSWTMRKRGTSRYKLKHGSNIPWQLLCRAACCRHPSFETTFVDINEVLYLRATLACACICLSFVVPCRCNCAITKNGSFVAIDADQPSITCDRRYESEVVATTLLWTPRS